MDTVIHTYGYGQTIFNSLNSLAMIRNSGLYPAMITTVSLMVGTFYAWQMAASKAEGEWRRYLTKIIGMLFLIQALLLPNTTMTVIDHVEKQPPWRVDNIPLAFALPIGAIEQLGHLLTIGFEQAFTLVGGRSSFNYYDYGTIFGARLAREVMNLKLRNPEFTSNMYNFIDRCVFTRAKIGHPFTMNELMESKDLWGLISINPGRNTRFGLIDRKVRSIPTCSEGIEYFEKVFEEAEEYELASLALKFKASGDRKKYNTGYRALVDNLKKQITALYENEMSVDKIIKHNLMTNSLNEYFSGNYPVVKAKLQQEASGLLSGDMGELFLTANLAVMKNIIYGSFIFLVPLMLISGGMSKYKHWITASFSLQLWPSLFAMLNMLIDYAYDPSKIVSYSNWSTEIKAFDSMASVAMGFVILIPMLAFWITKIGEGGILHLAGSLMANSSSAIAAGASDKTTGSRSWDNESIANVTRNNTSANKYDDNYQYFSGVNSTQQPDGSVLKESSDGSKIVMRGAGYDSGTGESSYKESNGLLTAFNKGLRAEEQKMSSTSSSYTTAKEDLISKEASALESIAKNTKADKGYNIDTSTEQGMEISKALNSVDKMGTSQDVTWKDNAEAHIRANPSLSNKLAGFLLGIDVGAGLSKDKSKSQSSGHSNDIINETQSRDGDSNHVRSSDNTSWLESVGVDKSMQKGIHSAYNKTHRLEKAMSAHKDTIDAYHDNIDYTRTHGHEFSREMYQDVVDAYIEKYKVDAIVASKAASKGTDEAIGVFDELIGQKADQMLGKIHKGRDNIRSSNLVDELLNEHESNITTNPNDAVKDYAKEHSLPDVEETKTFVDNQGKVLRDITAHNENQFLKDASLIDSKLINKRNNMSKLIKSNEDSSIINVSRPVFNQEEELPSFTPIIRDVKTGQMLADLREKKKWD